MIIDFKEIDSRKEKDDFEMFARDYFDALGFNIVSQPGRGQDGGLDLKIERYFHDNNSNIITQSILVSCKHYAKSGKSVGVKDETDILERMIQHDCTGFYGFYSTNASQSLIDRCEKLKSKGYSFNLFDKGLISKELFNTSKVENVFMKYFPNSYKNWKDLYFHKEPIKLFQHYLETEYSNNYLLKEYYSNQSKDLRPELYLFMSIAGEVTNLFRSIRSTSDLIGFFNFNSFQIFIDEYINHENTFVSPKKKIDKKKILKVNLDLK